MELDALQIELREHAGALAGLVRTMHKEVVESLKEVHDKLFSIELEILKIKRRKFMKKSMPTRGTKAKSSKPMPFVPPGGKGKSEAPRKAGGKRGR